MRRKTSHVSFLVCPLCVRDLLSVLTTENTGCDARALSWENEQRLRSLLEVGRALVSNFDLRRCLSGCWRRRVS
jgi:hypothetical protein